MKSTITFAFFLFSTALYAQDEEPCKLLLQNGLYRTYQMAKTGNFQKDLKMYFSSEQFKKDFRDNKWGSSLSVITDAVPIELGVNASDSKMNEFQNSIRNSTSLTINQSFYDYAYTNIPDIEIAKTYMECIDKSRKFGFKLNASVSDKEVLFIVSYYKEIESDPMPKVVRFEIRGAYNITKSFNMGDLLKNQTSITCDRDPNKDLILVLETDRGVASYKVPADPTGFNKDLPVGTIITSYLNWTEFQVATNNNLNNPIGNIWTAKFSKWAPADGREVPNSAFQRIANQTKLPDLRGLFVRGLNQFDQDQSTIVAGERKDPDTRVRGSYQADLVGAHSHGWTGHSGNGNPSRALDYIPTDPTGREDAYVRKPEKGYSESGIGSESRPKNIAVYYYIRIN
ncbi:hypothetical protein [Pararcticibacter amylolyticus]|uniref:Phage tail collar domain-containing protein n=1 Tax=Pararcticibacter amylolyticus TaxID=2173175 RepID=A0A2U2PAP3_9SPHI|nr:hypothetical protein [Pararcticibacter amylolyticus]PWG78425.1 hypothetical protein DDR33_22360 [Pararcticibacter amylolyticus]